MFSSDFRFLIADFSPHTPYLIPRTSLHPLSQILRNLLPFHHKTIVAVDGINFNKGTVRQVLSEELLLVERTENVAAHANDQGTLYDRMQYCAGRSTASTANVMTVHGLGQ